MESGEELSQKIRVELDDAPGTLEKMTDALEAAGVDVKALAFSSRGLGERGEVNFVADDGQLAPG